MSKNQIEFIFTLFTKALMTMAVCGCVYLVRTIVWMYECPITALQLYHSFPELVEHIVAGVLFYVMLGFLLTKLTVSSKESV